MDKKVSILEFFKNFDFLPKNLFSKKKHNF